MNRRGFFALLVAPLVARFLPKQEKPSIFEELELAYRNVGPTWGYQPPYNLFLSKSWADRLRAVNGGILPESWNGCKIFEVGLLS